MSDEILIRRTQNGWILTQYNHDDEEAYGPLTTVHEDTAPSGDQATFIGEVESLSELLQEAFPYYLRTKNHSGLEITVYTPAVIRKTKLDS